jgi:hypothetical protein
VSPEIKDILFLENDFVVVTNDVVECIHEVILMFEDNDPQYDFLLLCKYPTKL